MLVLMQCLQVLQLLWVLVLLKHLTNEGWGRLGWGINDWGDAGSSMYSIVTGIAMTAALGTPTEVTGDATIVANTLNVAQLTLGVVDPAPDAMLLESL